MDTRTGVDQSAHVSILLPLEPENLQEPPSPLSPPPNITPSHLPLTSHQTTLTMHSDRVYSDSAYPREADSDSDASSNDSQPLSMEDPLFLPSKYQSRHISSRTPSPPLSPPSPSHPSPPPSSRSLAHRSPLTEPTLRHQSSISEDLLCTICTSLLHDPVSLHCGHSFCQLCLASMWKNSGEPASAVNLKCPVCRSSWRNFPGINIQLRSIIERSYPQKCADQGSATLPKDNELLAKFKQTRERESQLKDKVNPQLRRDEVRRLVTGLCCIFSIVLALLVLLFSLMFWVWAGAGGEFMRKPAIQWSREDVAEWVDGLGNWAMNNYSQLFLGEHITGQRLLQLDDAALKAIGIKNGYRRQSILYGIQELKGAEYSTPRNFIEFKAAHRRQTLVIAIFYALWPRLTLLYVYAFNYYEVFLPFMRYHFPTNNKEMVDSYDESREQEGDDVPQDHAEPLAEPSYRELVAMFIEMMLIPHFLVALFAWSWAGEHPWIAYPIIVHCVWRMWAEGKLVVRWVRSGTWESWQVTNWRVGLPQLCKTIFQMALKQYFFFIFLFFVITMLWHVTPHFLCDILFYYLVWHAVAYNVCLAPLLHCLRFFGGNNFQAQFQMNIRGPGALGQQQQQQEV